MDVKSVLSGTIGADVLEVPFSGQHRAEELERLVDAKMWLPKDLPMKRKR
jgi:hypothetical protein